MILIHFFWMVCATTFLHSENSKFIKHEKENKSTEQNFPTFIPKYLARRDYYSGQPLTRGRIELLGGLIGRFTYRMNGTSSSTKRKVGKRVHLSEFKRMLQCAPYEPDLEGNRGSMNMLRLLPPSQFTVKYLCARIETHCDNNAACHEQIENLSSGKYRDSFELGSWLGLLRIIKDDVYLDWPWGRHRWPGPFESMSILIFHILDRVYGLPDSVFLMGSEYSNLKWNFPFPAFTNSPSFKHSDLPWPWVENFRSEIRLHQRVMEQVEKGSTMNSSMYHEAFAKQYAWHEKIPKALYRASILVDHRIDLCFPSFLNLLSYLFLKYS